jgi:hypothetical protein
MNNPSCERQGKCSDDVLEKRIKRSDIWRYFVAKLSSCEYRSSYGLLCY